MAGKTNNGKSKNGKRLGKGLDALIPGSIDQEPAQESVQVEQTSEARQKSEGERTDIDVNEAALKVAIQEAIKSPRIAIWSPESTALLKYLKKTIPDFSISRVASTLLRNALKDRYPELWNVVQERMVLEKTISEKNRER